mmetsp:Transcript_48015/g.99405  ORF Transcript_48015/g.99405 Transcript_48015/m.99405 type:complete len:575 (+) Transcript_48015:62-1786(+)
MTSRVDRRLQQHRQQRRKRNGSIGGSILFLALALHFASNLVAFCSARDCHTSFRRAWRDLTCQEQDDFLDAIITVKDSGAYDEFIRVHLSVATRTHGPAEFLPWHRWFIWNFEKLLQQTTGKCMYIPYWDWERDAEWESESDVMHPATFGSWGATTGNGCTANGITDYHVPFRRSPGVNNGPTGCVTRNFIDGFSFTGEAQVLAMIANYNQFSDTSGSGFGFDQNDPAPEGSTNSFRIEFENGPHMLVHGIIAGHMGTNWSPSDPLFYLHHSNVDRIWTMWQDYWDHDTCPVNEYTAPWHYDSVWGLDRVLPYQPSVRLSSWDFRMVYSEDDREPAFPTVRDVMNNDGPNMSVRYQNSYLTALMPDYEPNPRLFQAATDSVPVKCNRNRWENSRKRRELERENHKEFIENVTKTTHKDIKELNERNFPDFYRSSLRGGDAQEIENNIGHYFRGPEENRVKNSLGGLGGHGVVIRSSGADIVDVTNDVCGKPPVFTLQEDRDEWDRLCRELPVNTSMAERLALLAESDCNRKGNPRSDAPEIRERISMTMMEAFSAPSSAYECFHRPGDPPAEVR